MSEIWSSLGFRHSITVRFQNSSHFRPFCKISENWTQNLIFRHIFSKGWLKSELTKVQISDKFGFQEFRFQTITVWTVNVRNPNVRKWQNAEIKFLTVWISARSVFKCSGLENFRAQTECLVTTIKTQMTQNQITFLWAFGFQTFKNVRNPNIFVWISDSV